MGGTNAKNQLQQDIRTQNKIMLKDRGLKLNEKDIRLLVTTRNLNSFEYSINHENFTHRFHKVGMNINSVVTAHNNTSFFMSTSDGVLSHFDMYSKKLIKEIRGSRIILAITHDDKFIITSNLQKKNIYILWARNFKQISCFDLGMIYSLTCSYDNRYLFVGVQKESLIIIDILKNVCYRNDEAWPREVGAVAMSRDNQSAMLSDTFGNIRRIEWAKDTKSEVDFYITEEYGQVPPPVWQLCMTRDENNLFIGTFGSVNVLNCVTKEITKKFGQLYFVKGLDLVENGEKIIVIYNGGYLTIVDSEFREIQKKMDFRKIGGASDIEGVDDMKILYK